MDSQFNSLIQSYHDNYVQYKITGNQSYKKAYETAELGLDRLVGGLQKEVDTQRKEFADFYKSGVEQKLLEQDQHNRLLQRGIVREKDEIEAAKLRSSGTVVSSNSVSTTQYVSLGVLGAIAVGLSFL